MSSIDAKIIATRLRVAKNFTMLINAGVESVIASSIVSKYNTLSFSDIRIADDSVVICYNTCASKRSVNFALVA